MLITKIPLVGVAFFFACAWCCFFACLMTTDCFFLKKNSCHQPVVSKVPRFVQWGPGPRKGGGYQGGREGGGGTIQKVKDFIGLYIGLYVVSYLKFCLKSYV